MFVANAMPAQANNTQTQDNHPQFTIDLNSCYTYTLLHLYPHRRIDGWWMDGYKL